MDVDRERRFCQCNRNLTITFLCSIKTVRKSITLWARFIICIFTAIECKGSENSHIATILHYFGNTSSDTLMKKSCTKGESKTDYKDSAEKI